MKWQLLLNEISLMVATLFLIVACFTKAFWLISIGLIMIVYSANKVKKLKEQSHGT
jgi:hypothetical protein